MRAMAAVCGTRKQPSTSKAGSSSGRISSTDTRHCGASETSSQPATARGVSSPVSGSTSSIMTFWKSSAPATPSHTSWSTSSIERALGQARGDLQQLLERVAVACGLDGLLRALQGARGERHHGHEQVELVVGRAHAGGRLADRDDAQQVPVGVPAGHEQLVARDPGVGRLGSRLVGHVARAQPGVRPVDAALRDEVRPAALEAPLERQRPHRPLVGLPQQRLAHRLAAVDGADDEVVPRRPVEVEGHALEAERLGDRAGDLGQHGVEAAVGAHETGDVEQALHALQGDQLVDLCPVGAHLSQSSARPDRT